MRAYTGACPRCHINFQYVEWLKNYKGIRYCSNCADLVEQEERATASQEQLARQEMFRQRQLAERSADDARQARIAQERAAENMQLALEEAKKNASMNRYTCCHCQGSFREDMGYSALKTPIRKPICNGCYNSLVQCSCGSFFWRDESQEITGVIYECQDKLISKKLIDEPVLKCEKCFSLWKSEQDCLAEEYKKGIHKRARIIVSTDGEGDFAKVSEALQQTQCTEIFVKKGVYKDHFVVDRPLKIVGEPGAVIWDDTIKVNAIVVVCSENVSIENLELRGNDCKFDDGYCFPERPDEVSVCDWIPKCLYVKKTCEIRNVSASYSAGCGFVVGGAVKNLIVDNCKVFDNSGDGILVYGQSSGKLYGLEICDNRGFGIMLGKESTINIESCTIKASECKRSGAGIYMWEVSNSVIKNCKIYGIPNDGIYIENGRTFVDSCAIFSNRGAGIAIAEESNVNVVNSKIYDCQFGVTCDSGAFGELKCCKIYSNKKGDDPDCGKGIEVDEKSSLVIVDCEVYDNASIGVFVDNESSVTIKESLVKGNKNNGVNAKHKSRVSIENSEINKNAYPIYITEESLAVLSQCKIYENEQSGIVGDKNASTTLNYCNIFANKGDGVVAVGKSSAIINDCEIYGNQCDGLQVADQSSVNAKNLAIHHCRNGVELSKNSKSNFELCKISECRGMGVHSKGPGTFHGCQISDNYNGVWIQSYDKIHLFKCTIEKNKGEGVWIQYELRHANEFQSCLGNSAPCVIDVCRIGQNAENGILVDENGCVKISSCLIYSNQKKGIRKSKNSLVVMSRCEIHDNGDDSIETSFWGKIFGKKGN